MATHLEASLQRDIDRIREKIREMGTRAERALRDCVIALRDRNRQLAYSTILRDRRIDELEKEIDRLCLEFIVRQQPVAGHLRFAYATIRINLELERVGDYAEAIARQTLKLVSVEIPMPLTRFQEMADLSIPMLRNSVQAFVGQDIELARQTIGTEELVDELKGRLRGELIQLLRENKLSFDSLNALLMIVRHFERVSDQARNICVETIYMGTGEYMRHKGTEAVRLLFVDENNSCRSPMAEAIAKSLNQPQFIFSSAGLQPRPIDPVTADFLREKDLLTAPLLSRAVDQVPNLDHYQLIIALSEDAKKVFPKPPTKTVCIEWLVADPSQVQGTPAEVKAAYEKTYDFLKEQIHDLIEAVLGENGDSSKS